MKYICHNRYNKKGASGKEYLIRFKDEIETVGRFIAKGAEGICTVTSDDAFRHFARNDDGKGLERGKLTYKIAYAPRHPNEDNDFRFTEEEIEMLRKEYGNYLVRDNKAVIFNFDFFNAEIEELKELYERLWPS